MTNSFFTTRLFLDWHEVSRWFAYGLLATLLLFVVFQHLRSGRHLIGLQRFAGRSLGASIGVGVILLGLAPTLALGLLLSERSAHSRQDRMETRIEEMATAVSYSVERFVDKHLSGMTTIASSINASGDFGQENIQEALLRFHNTYGDFLTMLATDEQGSIVAATSMIGGKLQPFEDIAGFSVADREYFLQPMSSGFPFVSQAFRGRGFGADPIVAISASLRAGNGKRVGVVEGSLNLRAFESIEREQPQIDGASLVLLDDQSRVIYASGDTDLVFLEDLGDSQMVMASLDARQRASYRYELDVGRRSQGFIAAHASTSLGWRVYVNVSTDPIAQQMLGDYKVGLILLLLVAIISMLMASAFMRRVGTALGELNEVVQKFTLEGTEGRVEIPENAPTEFRSVFEHMQQRSRHLRGAYRRLSNSIEAGEKLRKELTQTIALKEVEVAERTAELESANKELASQNRRDPLTKIANRREFDAFENRVWNLGAREQMSVAVVLIDIDYFKIYNDTLGHQAGDDCLKLVAQALTGCANRPLDLVARYGGEEFVAVLGGAAVADALIVAENMRNAILDLEIVHPATAKGVVTVSVGAASVVPSPGGDASSLIKAADEALYHAKEAGRNRVVFQRDDKFVTYDPEQHSLDSTNIIKILAGDRLRKAKGPRRN